MPVPDPSQISTADELRKAVFDMIPHAQDRAVEQRTGLGKSSVNALRNGRRKFTRDALDKIVRAYDPARRDAWLEAWERVQEPVPKIVQPPVPGTAPGPLPEPRPPAEAVLTSSPIMISRTMAGMVLGVIVILAVLVVVSLLGFFAVSRVTVVAPGFSCPDLQSSVNAPVTSEPGAQEENLALMKTTYSLPDNESIRLAGGLSGAVPSDAHVYMFTAPDPGGRFYPGNEVTVSNGSCFQVQRRLLRPVGATGTQMREYLALVREDPTTFEREGASGFTQTDLNVREVRLLGYITVPTA